MQSLFRKFVYVLSTPLRRWKNVKDEMYFIDMPLKACPEPVSVQVMRKDSFDAQVEAFALHRQQTDPIWQGQDYFSVVRRRLETGEWCYLAVQDGRPVGAAFGARHSHWVDAVRYKLAIPARTAVVLDVYTDVSVRGQGLYSQIFHASVNDLLERGFQTLWVFIMPHNRHSFIVHERLGMQHVFRKVVQRQRWGFQWWRIRSLDMSVSQLVKEIDGTH